MSAHTKKYYLKKGRSLQVRLCNGLYRIHIVEIVDCEMVVYRYYGIHKQWWHYGVEHWKNIKFYHELRKNDKKRNIQQQGK